MCEASARTCCSQICPHSSKAERASSYRNSWQTGLETCRALRAVIKEFQAPYHLAQFSSLMTLTFPPDQKLAGLLFYLLRERGILIWGKIETLS